MCGIAGVIHGPTPASVLGTSIVDMTTTLRHRGPDQDGFFTDEAAGVAIGHRRLSIIDLSPAGAQPMTSHSGRWVVAYNGEVYNHHALRTALGDEVAEWRGHSDTETLTEAIDAWGIEQTLSRVEGMFAIAAYDTQTRQLVLARDRLGEKPLYWMQQGALIAFASELVALREVSGAKFDIDAKSAAALLRWSFIPHPHTIYADVHQISPGHYLVFDADRSADPPIDRAWWSLGECITAAKQRSTPRTLDAAADEFAQLLATSVSARLESDVPLGAFLSGGIDSSLVAAFAQRAMGHQRLRTFTVSMPFAGLDESGYASAVAEHLGTDHTTLNMRADEAFDLIPRLPAMWNEPFADPSMLPSALLCRAAREHVEVCIGGDGGDELFAGYNRHSLGVTVDKWGHRLPRWARRRVAAMALRVRPRAIDFVGRMTPGLHFPNLADKVQKAAHLLREETPVWDQLAGIWPSSMLGLEAHGPQPSDGTGSLTAIEEMMLTDTATVLPDQMLVKVDRASMASSLEVRSPLLASEIVEYSWSLPIQYKTNRGVGKLVMRRLAEDLLPKGIADRHKLGFDPPLARWLRNELRPWAEDLLAKPRCVELGWLDETALRTTWAEHLSGRRNWEYRLWAVLMLEAWLDEHHRA